ncbi:MAG: hypothetical protein RLZZ249_37 [Actinomycetota bacterium]|jgi:hypothetical protein
MAKSKLISIVLLGLNLPILFVGLIDPLEGGLALLLAGVVFAIALLVGRTKPPVYLWVSYLAAIVIGVLTIVAALTIGRQAPYEPLNPIVRIGVWVYRLAVAGTLVSTLIFWIGLIRQRAS